MTSVARAPLLLAVVAALVAAACGSGAATTAPSVGLAATPVPSLTGSAPALSAELQVYAAASLRQVLARLTDAFTAANPGVTFAVSTDSSAALETKIEQGAPADVFLSADTRSPQALVDGGFATGDVVPFAGNLLTVIVPRDNPAGIVTPADLATPGVKIVAAGDEVPITAYATQLVTNLAAQPGYPAGFEAAYAANIVSREDNVSAVVAKVRLGEGDAGIVYVTDAAGQDDLTTVSVPDAANVPAAYGGVAVKAGVNPYAAAAFLAWLAGPDAQAILAACGFTPAP